MRASTTYWKNATWDAELPRGPIGHAASNQFKTLRVDTGDRVYITTIRNGQMYVDARLTVGDIVTRTQANENPSGLGAFVYNLRFPGQYFDAETSLHYNYFRDYDPTVGRYVQSDPVGIIGGVNTYAYGYDNPVGFYDPSGLTSIQVNVASGMMLVDPEVKGRPPYSIPITSGRGQCQNNPKCSANKNQGPLPPGKYQLNVGEISQLGAFGTLLRQLRGDWGSWRVPLHPLPATNVMGRSGFFLHGGQIPGSAGCVDFGGGIFGNSLTDELLQDIRNDPNGIVPLTVQ